MGTVWQPDQVLEQSGTQHMPLLTLATVWMMSFADDGRFWVDWSIGGITPSHKFVRIGMSAELEE
jgi:hypothetical protein